jgi:hypothetical protein
MPVVVPTNNDPRLALTLHTLAGLSGQLHRKVEILVCGATHLVMPSVDCRFLSVDGAAKGDCVRAGLESVSHEVVLVCDADLPVAVGDLISMLRTLAEADVAWGNRYLPESGFLLLPPLSRRIASGVFRWCVRRSFPRVREWDTQCGIKGFRTELGQEVAKGGAVGGFAFDVELALNVVDQDVKVRQVPVSWKHREGSTIRLLWSPLKMIRDLREIRLRRGRSTRTVTKGRAHISH